MLGGICLSSTNEPDLEGISRLCPLPDEGALVPRRIVPAKPTLQPGVTCIQPSVPATRMHSLVAVCSQQIPLALSSQSVHLYLKNCNTCRYRPPPSFTRGISTVMRILSLFFGGRYIGWKVV